MTIKNSVKKFGTLVLLAGGLSALAGCFPPTIGSLPTTGIDGYSCTKYSNGLIEAKNRDKFTSFHSTTSIQNVSEKITETTEFTYQNMDREEAVNAVYKCYLAFKNPSPN
jgi:hypothetical protein